MAMFKVRVGGGSGTTVTIPEIYFTKDILTIPKNTTSTIDIATSPNECFMLWEHSSIVKTFTMISGGTIIDYGNDYVFIQPNSDNVRISITNPNTSQSIGIQKLTINKKLLSVNYLGGSYGRKKDASNVNADIVIVHCGYGYPGPNMSNSIIPYAKITDIYQSNLLVFQLLEKENNYVDIETYNIDSQIFMYAVTFQ